MIATIALLPCRPGLRLYLRGNRLRPLDETSVELPIARALLVVADKKYRLSIPVEPVQDPIFVPGAPGPQLLEVGDGAALESVGMRTSEGRPFMLEQVHAAQDRLPCLVASPLVPPLKLPGHRDFPIPHGPSPPTGIFNITLDSYAVKCIYRFRLRQPQ
jgi:hypothetical protein